MEGKPILTPEQVPERTPKSRYREVIEDFANSDYTSAKVQMQGIGPKALASGLNAQLPNLTMERRIRVVRRGDKVYLVKEAKKDG